MTLTFLSIERRYFNSVSFDLLRSRALSDGWLKFVYGPILQSEFVFVARCTLIPRGAAPMLSRVT